MQIVQTLRALSTGSAVFRAEIGRARHAPAGDRRHALPKKDRAESALARPTSEHLCGLDASDRVVP